MSVEPGYYRQPAVHGDTVVFVCEDDLWSAPLAGGPARRLTASQEPAAFPVLSPDGRWIAFRGQADGPTEIYVMPADGGSARRLTWLGGLVRPVAWTRDGRSIVFQSPWRQPFRACFHLHTVPREGGRVRRLPFGPAREIAYEPKGKGVVLGINSGDPARWKRYRGGTAGALWIDRKGTGGFTPLLRLDGNLAGPMWIGSRVYFLSDHEGHGNLYSCTKAGRGLRRHTDHEDFYVRYPSTDGKRIVYHAGADLYVFDPKTGESRSVEIRHQSARPERRRRFVRAARFLESADLHPAGHTLACGVRGGAFRLPLWSGAPVRHGAASSARHRLVRWLPDGKRIVAVTDEKGEEGLVVFPAGGGTRPRRIRGDFGRVVDLAAAPRGNRVALANHRQQAMVVDLTKGTSRTVERSAHDRIHGLAWSPDGRWLAYGISVSRRASAIHLYDTRTRKVHEITRPDFHDRRPAFDPEGKYLYFLSHRVYDPVYDNLYFDLGFPRGVRPYLVPLRATTPSPFASVTRPPRPPAGAEDDGKDKKAKKRTAPVAIDLADIADRVVAFPVEDARYERVLGGAGRVFFSSLPIEGSLGQDWAAPAEPPAKAWLECYTFETDKTETLREGVTDFSVSADGRSLLVRVGNALRVLPASIEAKDISQETQPGRATGWVDLERLRVAVEPGAEWRQMLDEAWRLQRDQFWTPDMSDVDWQAVHERYAPLVERVATRSEFSDLLWEMQGELGTSHCYELGGDYRPGTDWHQGFLGADLDYDARAGRWRIARIPRGDSWEPQASSPLAAPGLGVREGDALVAVDGHAPGPDLPPEACLVNQAAREVVLRVRSAKGKEREVAVKALQEEFPLRYRDWVEGNRARVHEATKGRVGYLHLPDMGPLGYSEFHRYFKSELDRDGLVVDVRWNGGGHVSQLLLEKLLRKRVGYDASRWQGTIPYPEEAPVGPMVALTNEYAGSDGDIFSHCFKLYGLGPLIGKRTWGGVVGIWPRHTLVDGTVTTQPEYGFWFRDVGWGVENYGTAPDIEVEIRPQDHARGRDPQLDRALAEIGKILRRVKPGTPRLDQRPARRPPRLPK